MARRNNSFLLNEFLAFLFSFIIFGCFCIFYTLLIYFTDVNFNKIIVFLIGLFSFLILGFLSGNFLNKKGFIIGFINSGIVIFIVILIKDFKISNLYELIKYLCYLLIGSCGGILGLNFKSII